MHTTLTIIRIHWILHLALDVESVKDRKMNVTPDPKVLGQCSLPRPSWIGCKVAQTSGPAESTRLSSRSFGCFTEREITTSGFRQSLGIQY